MISNSQQAFAIRVPVVVDISKSTQWLLNLNNYRNAHYMVLNNAKRAFEEAVETSIETIPVFSKIRTIEYVLYRDSKRNCDVANVCSIVDKFFSDTLVKAGKLPDDNWHYLKEVTYRWGGITNNGSGSYVEVIIKGESEMKINLTLNQDDITNAIKEYVTKSYPSLAGEVKTSTVDLTAGRNGNGISANISFDSTGVSSEATTNASKPNSGSRSGNRSDVSRQNDTELQHKPADTTGNTEGDVSTPEPEAETDGTSTGPRVPIFGRHSDETGSSDPDKSLGVSEEDAPLESSTETNTTEDTSLDNAPVNIFGRKKSA